MKAICAALLVFLVMVFVGEADAGGRQYVKIGTGGITGVYYPTGGAICRLLNRDRNVHGIRCTADTSGGSIDNLNGILKDRFQFGLVRSDILYNANEGGRTGELRSVFSVHSESLTIVARKDSGIRTLRDLKNKKINIGTDGSPEREAMNTVMKAFRWDTRSFQRVSELPSAEQILALKSGTIDAAVFMADHPSGRIKEATSSCDTIIVPITDSALKRLIQTIPYYRSAVIPGGIYCGADKSVESIGFATTLVTSVQVPDQVVYNLVKAVFDNFDQFRKLHPAFSHLNPVEMANTGLSIPQHEAALKYFKARGYK